MKRLGMLGWLVLSSGLAGCPRGEAGSETPAAVDWRDGTLPVEARVRGFLDEFVPQRAALDRDVNLAYWAATNASSEEESAREYARKAELELEWRRLHADRERFAALQEFRDSAELTDPLLRRQVELLYLTFLPNQIPDELLQRITDLSNEIEQTFNAHRAQFEGSEVSDNDLREVLQNETDSTRRRAAWEALKQIGPVVADRVRELARLRNQAAQAVGYPDYWQMMMAAQEMPPDEVLALFDRVYEMTEEPYTTEKAKLDATLAERYGVTVDGLRPWHCADPFCQSAPQATDVDLDRYFANPDPEAPDGSNLVALAEKFYAGFGMDVAPILARSDLYERPFKEQHAYCTDIDRAGDVRMLLNLKSNGDWADTILHELGHAVYFVYTDRTDLPYLLREMHTVSTEAIAELMGGMTKNARWLQELVGVPAEEAETVAAATRLEARLQKLIFARWSLVMLHFERALYGDPEQDLDTLWWDLVERYQKVTRPEGRSAPDWATKIHVATVPVYYHNYLMGEMMAAQILEAVAREVYGGAPVEEVIFYGKPEAGRFLIDRIFSRGHVVRWDDLIVEATGEPLGPRAFVEQLR
ncbi:MAG: M2 family metallopeptidase [Myxococcales bacterium]|nr:M2 family metallopeptidase [Myxococcales bacterium]